MGSVFSGMVSEVVGDGGGRGAWGGGSVAARVETLAWCLVCEVIRMLSREGVEGELALMVPVVRAGT